MINIGKVAVTIKVDEVLHDAVKELKNETGINISMIYEKGAKGLLGKYGKDIKEEKFDRLIKRISNE